MIAFLKYRDVTCHPLLVTRRKFTRCSLIVANSLAARYSLQNHSLFVAEIQKIVHYIYSLIIVNFS